LDLIGCDAWKMDFVVAFQEYIAAQAIFKTQFVYRETSGPLSFRELACSLRMY